MIPHILGTAIYFLIKSADKVECWQQLFIVTGIVKQFCIP